MRSHLVYVLLKQYWWNCYHFHKETARTIITVGVKEILENQKHPSMPPSIILILLSSESQFLFISARYSMNTEGSEWQAVFFWKWASPKNMKFRKQIWVQCQSYWSLTVNFTLIVLSTASTRKFPTDILCSPAISSFPTNPRFHHTSPG